MRWFIKLFGGVLSPAARRFYYALDHPGDAQRRVQKEICDRLIASDYGRSLGIQSVTDWHKIPIVEYDKLEAWISPHRCTPPSQENGAISTIKSLTPEPILFYEKTSGSRGPAKWIPYTQSLRQSFNHLFCVWAHDLITNGPAFRTGKLYFCISPQLGKNNPSTSGLSDDSDYLDGWLRVILSPFLVSPPGLARIQDPEAFKHQLCLALLAAAKLEIISIWSPTFLKVQLDYIEAHRDELIRALGSRLSLPRRRLLQQPEIPWPQLWPELKLISCWDSANAADQADWLRARFPGVLVQGKGLLATEAPMTVPLIAARGYVPLIDEVFFEFEDQSGAVHQLDELHQNQTYSIILSQKGGLYRYRIGDRVRVTHTYRNTPCLEFIGRDRTISDLVGEKLHEAFVQQVLAGLPLHSMGFKSLMPVKHPVPHYVLLLDQPFTHPDAIAQQLDQALCQSPHYSQARLLGQLTSAKVLAAPEIPEILTQSTIESGKTWGDIKYSILGTQALSSDLYHQLQAIAQL